MILKIRIINNVEYQNQKAILYHRIDVLIWLIDSIIKKVRNMKIDKKVILIIIASFLCISCMENGLNFELKIESELEEFYKEKIEI